VEQRAKEHAREYDRHSFRFGMHLRYPRVIQAKKKVWLAQADRAALDDDDINLDFIREARAARRGADLRLVDAQAARARADEARDQHRRALLDGAWKAPERLYEPGWNTWMRGAGMLCLAIIIDVPWAYFAIEVLGESPLATAAITLVFAGTAVVLAHLAGVLARHGRAGRSRGHYVAAAACVACLLIIALGLSDIRYAALAAPIVTSGGEILPSGLSQYSLSGTLIFAVWLGVTLGLWSAVGILAYLHTNPHVSAHRRAQQVAERVAAAYVTAATEAEDAEAALENQLARRRSCQLKWCAFQRETEAFVDLLTAEYPDALAEARGDPDFTTALEVHLAEATPAVSEGSTEPLELPRHPADLERPKESA
jgi:hypothetical protein